MKELREPILPFHNHDLTVLTVPKNKLDRGLFYIFLVAVPTIYVWETFVVVRYRSGYDCAISNIAFNWSALDSVFLLHTIIMSFIMLNILGNFLFIQDLDSSVKRKTNLPSSLPPKWRYCHFCNLNAPPRSYHCPICDECILRRDQHCMFAGCCVGFYNHRYYLMTMFYIMIGSLYSGILQWQYCIDTIGGYTLKSVFCMAAPHIAFLFGFLSIFGFICAITQIILMSVCALTAYILLVQIKCISQGQTIHEKRAGITLYDLGWKLNFIQIFGRRWYYTWIFYVIDSPIEGDGTNFLTFYDLEEIKNV